MTKNTFIKSLLVLLTSGAFIFFGFSKFSFDKSDKGHAEERSDHIDEHSSHDEHKKGPHGGRLLIDGAITVELVFSETGNSAVFKAWITQGKKPVKDKNVSLKVKLTRLDGKITHLNFKSNSNLWVSMDNVEKPHSYDVQVILDRSGRQYRWAFNSYEGRVEIKSNIAAKAGIKSKAAKSGLIKQTIVVYGKTVADPLKISHIRARFPGTITKIRVNIGDRVKAGDVLAVIESSTSLKHYTITSPLTGIITERNGNPGELAQKQALLTVANYDKIWVEFRIFPSQFGSVSVNQSVIAFSDYLKSKSTIKHLIPSNTGQPFKIARVPLDNLNGQWVPGLLLGGRVEIKQMSVALAVDNRALQSIRGRKVVFVQVGNTYEMRSLKLGLSGGKFTEVLNGLNVGDKYVVENSYFLKADLGKSGASHDH